MCVALLRTRSSESFPNFHDLFASFVHFLKHSPGLGEPTILNIKIFSYLDQDPEYQSKLLCQRSV